jgi:hypothetical protein
MADYCTRERFQATYRVLHLCGLVGRLDSAEYWAVCRAYYRGGGFMNAAEYIIRGARYYHTGVAGPYG